MSDLASLLAVGLAGLATGAAYATRGHMKALERARTAGVILIHSAAFRLAPVEADDAGPELRLARVEAGLLMLEKWASGVIRSDAPPSESGS